MNDPYQVLGLAHDADDETIRRRYLELVRQFPPEHHPEKFAQVKAAYDALKDVIARLRSRLFELGKNESVAAIIEEVQCNRKRRRLPLATLLAAARKS